jgi:hypothetical protein
VTCVAPQPLFSRLIFQDKKQCNKPRLPALAQLKARSAFEKESNAGKKRRKKYQYEKEYPTPGERNDEAKARAGQHLSVLPLHLHFVRLRILQLHL